MPLYAFKCSQGHGFDRYLKFADYDAPQTCECGSSASRQISAALVFVQPNVCYDSPIDGRPITNKQARLEDLKRHGCIEYDPGMKQDYQRRLKESEEKLDRSVEDSVEREFAQMPTPKKEKLAAEIQAGFTPEIERREA